MIKKYWEYILSRPELLFLLFAVPYGLAMIAITPPLGGGDEGFHLHRIASVGYLQILNSPVIVPQGITRFLDAGLDFFHAGLEPPFHYTSEEWHKVQGIGLDPAHTVVMQPNPVTIHHPFSYLPQIVVFMITAAAGLKPLTILYVLRVTGLVAGTYLTYLAIRLMPSHKYMLCAIALLPTITFYRSYINADAFTDGLAFVFIAIVFNEIIKAGKISREKILYIAFLSFVLAQAKSAYLFLPVLTLAIPTERFASPLSRLGSLLFIMLPGAFASIAWMLIIKHSYFTGVSYHTWGGDTNPERQVDFILHHPLEYLKILLHTLFFTPLIPSAIEGLIDDVGPGYMLPVVITLIVLFLGIKAISYDRGNKAYYPPLARMSAFVIFAAVTVFSLTILYVQWTGFQAPIIKGFQGRYFFPVLPLLALFIFPSATHEIQKSAYHIALMAFLGLSASLWQIMHNFY